MTLPGGVPALPPTAMPANVSSDLNSSGGIADFAKIDEPQVRAFVEAQWGPHFEEMGGPIEVIREIANVVVSTLLGDFDPFAALFGSRPIVEKVTDGQMDLLDRIDLLAPLLDYGSCFADGQGGILNNGRVPFNRQIGPMTGCELVNDAIVLEEEGLWDINARLGFSYTLAPGGGLIQWRVSVYRPNGTVFSRTLDEVNHGGVTHRQISTSVVVPGPGYRVEVWITYLIAGRATTGGPEENRLTVQHKSLSTDHPI